MEEITLTLEQAAALRQGFRYCPRCRNEMVDRLVYGRVRRVCPDETCRFVQFLDPKVGAAALIEQQGQVLLVKRSVEPFMGTWCLPGGFMEIGETPQQTAQRECLEETGIEVEIKQLIDVYYYENYRGSGLLIIYHGQVLGGQLCPGDDAAEAAFFSPNKLPLIRFSSNLAALARWQAGEI
jgi:ADP-ribose pyrophosphatase YjhB (NUDIX family)